MIKQVPTDRVQSILTAAALDQILADLDAGTPVSKARIREAIAVARGGLDVPPHYLTDQERASDVIDAVQTAADPLQYARASLDQEFFGNSFLPYEMRRLVAVYLWGTFAERGNPIWKNYLDGTFKYIHLEDLQDDDE